MKIYSYSGKANIAGERIRLARVKAGITQNDLAAKMQANEEILLEQKAISRIENGQRVIADYELAAFARVLNVSPLWLLGDA